MIRYGIYLPTSLTGFTYLRYDFIYKVPVGLVTFCFSSQSLPFLLFLFVFVFPSFPAPTKNKKLE